jgi:hypothetical protein
VLLWWLDRVRFIPPSRRWNTQSFSSQRYLCGVIFSLSCVHTCMSDSNLRRRFLYRIDTLHGSEVILFCSRRFMFNFFPLTFIRNLGQLLVGRVLLMIQISTALSKSTKASGWPDNCSVILQISASLSARSFWTQYRRNISQIVRRS